MRFTLCTVGFTLFLTVWPTTAQEPQTRDRLVPTTWDDAAIATLELPLANPVGSPKHVSADYYYRIPVAPIYKSYPVYAPGREPARYLERLRQQAPEIIWDTDTHRPMLDTDADWVAAGEIVFDAPFKPAPQMSIDDIRNPRFFDQIQWPVAKDGSVPFVRYVVRQIGVVSLEANACAMCHTRVMPDGSILKGAQGNAPLGKPNAVRLRDSAQTGDLVGQLRLTLRATASVPWLDPDPEARLDQMSAEEFARVLEAMPPGVNPRHRASPLTPVQIPDLIGVKDRRYLDRTGLQQHRSIVDLMRYAAMNRGILDGGDGLANHNGFIPADPPRFEQLPDPSTRTRYSDEQLYALAMYLYSLQPPPNPNWFDDTAARGQQVFVREGCAACHTPPLYTNNKLTPADGFTIPPDHRQRFDILPRSVGTETDLTTRTRRGTGYYKVPSLKGVWYRGMFGHSGWCATLADWFDPRRVHDDYVPTGWKPHDRPTFAIKGHTFGLALSDEDRRVLIGFLKTL
jgi:hypothetical protein